MATASGPDPWVPVHISIDTDDQCQGYILALIDEAGDRASIVSLGPDAVEADARVGRGVSWKLEIDVDQHQLAEFAAIDDAYLAAGKLSCVEGFPSDVRVVRIGPARAAPDASWPSVAVAAGIMGFGLLVVIVVGRRLRARPD